MPSRQAYLCFMVGAEVLDTLRECRSHLVDLLRRWPSVAALPPDRLAMLASSGEEKHGAGAALTKEALTAVAREAAERTALTVARVSWKAMSEAERISRAEGVTLRVEDRTERGLARVLAADLGTTAEAVRKWFRKLDRAKQRAIRTKHGIA